MVAVVILLFTNLFPNSKDPNYGIFVYRRARQLRESLAHAVYVVAPVPYFPKWLPVPSRLRSHPRIARWLKMSRIPVMEQWGGITVYHPRYFLLPILSAPFHGLLMFLGAVFLVLKLHAQLRFDCVDAHFVYPDGFAAVLLGRLLRLPVVITAHGTDLNVYARSSLLRSLIRWTLKRTQRVICVSAALKNIVSGLKIPTDKVVVIPNGVDLDCFHPIDQANARRILGMPLDAEVVVDVGQLISRKGHHFLIQAVAHLCAKFPHLQLFIIGEGSSEKSLQQRISALGLERHVSLIGGVKNDELFRWYSAADVTCLASAREGFPCVLLESLACGTPVVATAIEGTSELVSSPDFGLLVQQDPLSISEGLERALQIDWVKTALARHARSFTWQQTAAAIEETLACSIRSRQTAVPGEAHEIAKPVNSVPVRLIAPH
ncbi:MAG: glycosyltransferase family 4 protein [Candidatus Sulfotelmatobacter sp.]|jgi:teichuronic acid biosynthesis glycosyltransferase TuaC